MPQVMWGKHKQTNKGKGEKMEKNVVSIHFQIPGWGGHIAEIEKEM